MTSLYAVLKGIPVGRENYRKEQIHVAFCPKEQKFEVADAAIRRDPEFIPDISQLWSGGAPRRRVVRDFFERLRTYRQVDEDEGDRLSEVIDHLYDLQNYPFTALELSPTMDEEQVTATCSIPP